MSACLAKASTREDRNGGSGLMVGYNGRALAFIGNVRMMFSTGALRKRSNTVNFCIFVGSTESCACEDT